MKLSPDIFPPDTVEDVEDEVDDNLKDLEEHGEGYSEEEGENPSERAPEGPSQRVGVVCLVLLPPFLIQSVEKHLTNILYNRQNVLVG